MVAFIALVGFGMVRVTLSAKAAEASIDAGRLRQDIRAAELVADDLEVDRSALMTPSRIEAIATSTMRMASPGSVKYIAMPGQASSSATVGQTDAPARDAAAGDTSLSTESTSATPGGGSETTRAEASGIGAAFGRALTTVVSVAAGGAHLLLGVDGHVVADGE